MSISSEHVHVSVLVNLGRVTITSSRPHVMNETELSLQMVGGVGIVSMAEVALLLSLLHLLVVHIEGFVSVLDDEGVLHRVGNG